MWDNGVLVRSRTAGGNSAKTGSKSSLNSTHPNYPPSDSEKSKNGKR